MVAESGLPIKRIDREEFITDYFDYKPGEHVSIIGATGNGKTTLALQLLKATAHPKLPAVILAMKPKDDTIDKYRADAKAEGIDYRLTRTWPPRKSLWTPGTPHGWVLSPKHTFDPYRDSPDHTEIFDRALLDSYKRGNRIIFADEAVSLTKELGLGLSMDTLWTKGRSMKCGMWAATQRPAWVPRNMFDQSTHLFLDYPADKQTRDRYKEISGVDPEVILRALRQSSEEEFAWVYVKPNGRRSQICVVSA